MSAGGIATIRPGRAHGRLTAPPSKSIAHRLLISAALSDGVSTVCNLAPSEDILATCDCLRVMGAQIDGLETGTCTVRGPIGRAGCELDCRESGSTLRFLLPLCLDGSPTALAGRGRLLARPMDIYAQLCRERGIAFDQNSDRIAVCGRLTAGEFFLRGDVSSQFITGLLFALVRLDGDSRIRLTTAVESRSYIDLTLEALQAFGVRIEWIGERELYIPGNQRYRAADVTVEGDHSNAAFFGALNAMGGQVTVDGLREESRQGDRVWQAHLSALAAGCPTVSLADCPDLGPVLMAVAAAGQGAVFTDAARLRLKESDRGAAMARELGAFGVKVDISPDGNTVTVHGGTFRAPDRLLDGHNDHRIVMSLALLCTLTGGRITDARAVAKSMPDFFEALRGLGIDCIVSEL
jgi:3-phosphoshikimate 1-carboxyvinyltransferase